MCHSPAAAAPPSGAGWNLAWNDEFSGTTMDTAKWRHWLPGARRDAVNSPSAIAVSDGKMTISTYTSGGTHYTGMVSTQNTYLYTYGYIEARINYDSSPGMWSAFWMQSPTMGNPIGSPNSAGTEIDICEHRAVDGSAVNRDGNIGGVIHWDGYGTSHRSYGYDSGNLGLGTGFHIYGMEWTPTQQKFYIDGTLRWTINNNAANSPVSQRSEFIILSSEVENGGWSSTVPAGGYGALATTTTKMEVDYVRVYQRAETVVNGDFEGKLAPFGSTNQGSWSGTGGRTNAASAIIAPTTSSGASVQQTVRGLMPATGYTLTAWGNAGVITPSLLIGAKSYGASDVTQALTNATYSKATVPFTTGQTNRTASISAFAPNSGSVAYADDFLLLRQATINNGQLESADSTAWTSIYGGAGVSSDGTNYGGEYAWKIPAGGSSAGVEQEVIGLTPSTAYRLTGWTTNGNAGLTFGVKNHGGTQTTSTVATNAWTRGTVNFTTGAASNSATIFAYRPSSAQTSYADSFFLTQPLTAPWASTDVSATTLDGTGGRLGGKFAVQAGGSNISATSDKMHFVYQPITGDATITARILGVDSTAYYAKCGVMIRESTAEGARSASVTWGQVNQLADFCARLSTGGSTVSSLTDRDIINPPWVRLTRRGNTFTAYCSPDGLAWARVGSPQTIAMSAATLVGVPACSGDESRLTEAFLDNVTVGPTVPDVLITSPAEGAGIPGNGANLKLEATVNDSGTPSIAWSKASGPGSVTFANPSLVMTSATFSAPGTYVLRCSATNATGTGSDDHTVNIAPVSSTDPALVLRLKLDEPSGTTAADSSGANNPGTANGGLVWQPSAGQLTGAAEFNGVDSYITVPDNAALDNTSAFTLSFWFKANSFNGAGLVAKRVSFDSNNSYGVFLTVDGKLNVDINSNNNRFTSSTTFNTGAWYHVAVVFDGSLASTERAKLYVNGALDVVTTETSTSIPNYTSALHIGTLYPGNPVFDGLIDEIRFHRRALSASEVASINNETGTFAPTVSAGTAPAAIVNTTAYLSGSVTVYSGPAATAAWSKVSGPGNVIFANATSPATAVTFDQPGNYVLRLTATNPVGQTFADLSDTVFAAILPPPVITITHPPGPVFLADALHSLRLTAIVATSGVPGTPTFAWSKSSGPGSITFADPSASDTTATFSATGNYILRCTVTNAGGTDTTDVSVAVATPASATFRQGENSYSHTVTFLRNDTTNWNSGARDQVLVGKKDTGSNFFRSVFSFPLTGVPANATFTGISLDLWTHDSQAGTGSVSMLELHELTALPVEGTGNSSTDAANGVGTGATWTSRTGAATAGNLWTSPGGDFNPTILSSVTGFNATSLAVQKTFPSSSSFIAAAQSAVASGSPLNLMLLSPSNESGTTANFTRLSSDDHATLTSRPLLTLTWTVNPAPVINPGSASATTTGEPSILTGSASGATSTTWSLVSGPGSATFGNAAMPTTSVSFSQSGTYILNLAASNPNAEVSKNISINVTANPAYFSDWQTVTWPGVTDPETIGPNMDPDHDGINNLLEWALSLDPRISDSFNPLLVVNGGQIQYVYSRRKTAPGEANFQVLWSDTLEEDWSGDNVSGETLISETGTTRTVRVSVPFTSDRRFLRVMVSKP